MPSVFRRTSRPKGASHPSRVPKALGSGRSLGEAPTPSKRRRTGRGPHNLFKGHFQRTTAWTCQGLPYSSQAFDRSDWFSTDDDADDARMDEESADGLSDESDGHMSWTHDNVPLDMPLLADESLPDHGDGSSAPATPRPLPPLSAAQDDQSTVPDTVTSNAYAERTSTLYLRWGAILPQLREPLLAYLATGAQLPQPSNCPVHGCNVSTRSVQLVDFLGCTAHLFATCVHNPLPCQLVRAGYFPSAPEYPQFAFSIQYLDFYHKMFEHASDSAQASAAALTAFHRDQGFLRYDAKGKVIHEGYHRPLQYAIQWYDVLCHRLELETTKLVQAYRLIADTRNGQASTQTLPGISEMLKDRCPCCFEEERTGRSLQEGLDFHVAIDLNFLQRHVKLAGECPPYDFEHVYMIPPEDVAAVADRITAARRKPPRTDRRSAVPDDAIDGCEGAHEAADETRHKTSTREFDDKGIGAMVCRHDIPLCFVNVDTPGESQKYALTCINWLFKQLPGDATVGVVYDIGCAIDRSCNKFDILADGVRERLVFVTAAMHAYAHQWACQIAYAPRMREGLGLTDGEGVERLWSRLRSLIGIARRVSRRRRLILLDRQFGRIHLSQREGLFRWLKRRADHIKTKLSTVEAALATTQRPEQYFRAQWKSQRDHQLSVRAHFTLRVQRNLKQISLLQDQIASLEERIEKVHESIGTGTAAERRAPAKIRILRSLQQDLSRECDELWDNVRIRDFYPELEGQTAEIASLAIRLSDIRHKLSVKLIGQYSEWQQIDRAVGGREAPLGTALHQRSRAAIKRRHPAIKVLITTHNNLARDLRNQLPEDSNLHPPDAVDPQAYMQARDNPVMLQELYMAQPGCEVPDWVKYRSVRDVIRALHLRDRCKEESVRIVREERNLRAWVGRQCEAIRLVAADPAHVALAPFLNRELVRLTVMESDARFGLGRSVGCSIPQRITVAPVPAPVPAALNAAQIPTHRLPSSLITPRHVTQELPQMQPALNPRSPSSLSLAVVASDEDEDAPLEEMGVSTDAEVAAQDVLAITDDADSDFELLKDGTGIAAPVPEYAVAVPQLQLVPPYQTEAPAVLSLPHPEVNAPAWTPEMSSVIPPERGFIRRLLLNYDVYNRLCTPDAYLNDDAINACIGTLCRLYPGRCNDVVVVSTYDLVGFAAKRWLPADIYTHVRNLEPWNRKVIVMPIHQGMHWMLCVVYPSLGVVEYFDSLGPISEQASKWCTAAAHWTTILWDYIHGAGAEHHAQKGGSRPVPLAKMWRYRVLQTKQVQQNGVDCGVWIIAQVEAILRGFRIVGWPQAKITNYRRWLARLLFADFPDWVPPSQL